MVFQTPIHYVGVYVFLFTGYIEKELRKKQIKVPDIGENPKAPAPKEMVDLEVCYITLSFILPQLIWQYTEPVNMSTFGEGTYASPHLYVLYIDLLDHLGYFLKWTFLQPLFYKSTCKWFEQKRGENSTKVVTHGDLCLCGTLEWSYSCFHQAIHYQLLSLPYSSFSVSHNTGNIKK